MLSRMISEEKQKNVHRIPYFIVPMYRFPGRYNIVFMPSKTVCTDSFLITNHGYKYRSEVLQNLNLLITNFKMVCQNPQQVRFALALLVVFNFLTFLDAQETSFTGEQ